MASEEVKTCPVCKLQFPPDGMALPPDQDPRTWEFCDGFVYHTFKVGPFQNSRVVTVRSSCIEWMVKNIGLAEASPPRWDVWESDKPLNIASVRQLMVNLKIFSPLTPKGEKDGW